MDINQSSYEGSFVHLSDCPKDQRPEYAFIGRSNVGKSSLVNSLVARKDLAKVSKSPGKTQTLNYFLVNENWYLVDLPGYGYAKVSQKLRASWQRMIENYLLKREELQCAFILIDSNIPLQMNDLNFMNWLGEKRVPFAIIYTKCDRCTKNQLEKNLEAIQTKMSEHWHALPTQFRTSAEKRTGQNEILEFIEEINVKYFNFLEEQ